MTRFHPKQLRTEQVVIYQVTQELLADHPLGEQSRKWGATQMTKYVNREKGNDQISWILLLMAKRTNTGRFALSFNEILDQILTEHQDDLLDQLVGGGPELFAELYQNDSLSKEERSIVERHVKREHNAMLNAIETLIAKGSCQVKFSLELGQPNGLFQKCYLQACLGDPEGANDPFLLVAGHRLPDVIFMVDREGLKQDSQLNHVYCFDYMDLLRLLCQTKQHEKPINPYTGRPFSDAALQQLAIRFRKEIKMYYFHHRHRTVEGYHKTTADS